MFIQTKPIISIILPVYNTSPYLEECLNSIHNQSFKDYELICIDDGSSDNSYEILKKYEKIITNCKVIYQNNQVPKYQCILHYPNILMILYVIHFHFYTLVLNCLFLI